MNMIVFGKRHIQLEQSVKTGGNPKPMETTSRIDSLTVERTQFDTAKE